MQITRENYRDLKWDESISFETYDSFVDTLDREEKITFFKFLLEKFPEYDEEWVEYFFDIIEDYRKEGAWEKICEFSDYLRLNCPEIFKKEFNIFTEEAFTFALFNDDLETAKARFATTVANPEKAIDDVLPFGFNLLSINPSYKSYTTEIAEEIWKPIEQSNKILGGAEFDYSLYLYCNYLEEVFTQIQKNETLDWEDFTKKVEAINFKIGKEFKELPELKIEVDASKFYKNAKHREEQLARISIQFFYQSYPKLGIPVYWLFRGWFNLREYLWEEEDAPRRKSWFTFTPKMLDRMGGSMMGFFRNNRHEMVITTFVMPHVFDFLLAEKLIDATEFSRLMDYYRFHRRTVLKITNIDLWQYSDLYNWEKPDFISQEQYENEKKLLAQIVNLTREDAIETITSFIDELSELPPEAIPPEPEPSPFEKMMNKSESSFFEEKSSGPNPNRVIARKKRKKKKKANKKRKKKKRK